MIHPQGQPPPVLLDRGLALELERIIEDLGFDLAEAELREVEKKVVDFFEEGFRDRYRALPWQNLAIKRELLRVLVGWWWGAIALAHSEGSPEELGDLIQLVARELSSHREGYDCTNHERVQLDVGAWNLRGRELASPRARLRHLHILAEYARLQDNTALAPKPGTDPAPVLRSTLERVCQ